MSREEPAPETSAVAVTFLGWEPGDNQPRKYGSRLRHKKSRAGCQQCRTRRVKCDEVHPVCGGCDRHQSACVWGRDRAAPPPAAGHSRPLDLRLMDPRAPPLASPAPELPESKERRLRELELLHHYTSIACCELNPGDPDHRLTQGVLLPRVAFTNDALLYAIFATAALHLAHAEPHEQKHVDSYQEYLGLAIRLHREDVARLSESNADATMLTSVPLRVVTFAVLALRPLDPYSPPLEWLHMNYGTGPGLAVAAWKFLKEDPTSLMRALLIKANIPGMDTGSASLRDDAAIFNAGNLRHLNHLLQRSPEQELHEPWDSEIRLAYSTTISHIGGALQAITDGEPEHLILRRLVVFPTFLGKKFVELVEERRYRALVVLAHYFGLLARFRLLWWVGEAGRREVEAIQKLVGDEWQESMEWPLTTIEQEPTLRPPEPEILDLESRLHMVPETAP